MNIRIKKSALKELKHLKRGNSKQVKKIIDAIYKIGIDPYLSNAIKLTDFDECRVRIGNYRILYHIDSREQIVTVVSVKHRKDAYRFFKS